MNFNKLSSTVVTRPRKPANNENIIYEKLKFRRQFLLARAPIDQLTEWNCLNIDKYYLYVHPDLEINRVDDALKSIVLIGNLFDPIQPEKKSDDILRDINGNTKKLDDLFLQVKPYIGSYALFFKDDKDTIIFNDALSLREIYYYTKENLVICGSQPNLLVTFSNPEIHVTEDNDLLDFFDNHLEYCSMIGDQTYYGNLKHLLPNHFLDIEKREVHRYWPTGFIERLSLEEAVPKICSFLQGSIRAMVYRHPIMMAVTAGWDSRTLLAASKGLQEKIYYFINDEGLGVGHPDISVPQRIFNSIGIPFHVHDVPNDMNDEFRKIFFNNTFFASDRILTTIYNVYFKHHSDKVNVIGTGEIGRTRFGRQPKNLNSFRLAYLMGYKESFYALKQSEQIFSELLPVSQESGINILTLFFWEQNQGNRWVVGNSESDIAIEEIDPFDSHLLYEIFLGVDEKYTQSNNILFTEIIRQMWPELLGWPVNPPHRLKDKAKWFLGRMGVFESLKELKYQLNFMGHLYKKWRGPLAFSFISGSLALFFV